jgi:glutathione reductase (NADPH)
MPNYDVDLFVIGAGSGGVRAARIAAGHGARVMIAEADRVGGTCVIRGCVPKKLMVLAGRFADDFADAQGFGWTIPAAPQHSWQALIAAKDKEIARLEDLYVQGLENSGVELKRARASIVDAHTVKLDFIGQTASQVISARHILVATGGYATKVPPVEGIEHAVTSDDMFHLPALPKRLAIVGGGYIAVEFAGLMRALGSDVTLIHRRDHLLRGFDEDLRTTLEAAYRHRGIVLKLEHTVKRIDKSSAGYVVTFMDDTMAAFDLVMVATGRKPNIAGLGLEEAGVALNHGAIAVNDQSTTNVPSIHAVGDVTDRVNLTPVAIREGHALADTLFGNKPTTVDHGTVATAVFSTPEIGCVGLTEAAARDKGLDISVFMARFRPIKATLSGSEDRTLMKLVVDKADDRVIGVHILGEAAAELIQAIAVAITCGATKAQFDATIAVHPSAAEELVTMRQPVR